MSNKELLFSVTASDCDWDYFRGSGNGGQNKQKTSSACRCTHRASKAVGVSQDYREQRKNREAAFARMAKSEIFQKWLKIEISKKMLDKELIQKTDREIENEVEKQMSPENLLIQGKNEKGEWVVELNSINETEEYSQ